MLTAAPQAVAGADPARSPMHVGLSVRLARTQRHAATISLVGSPQFRDEVVSRCRRNRLQLVDVNEFVVHWAGKVRAVEDEGVELPVFAAGIDSRRQIGNEARIELATAKAGVEETRVNADDARPVAEREQLVDQPTTRFLPQRQRRSNSHGATYLLFPVTVCLQVDVAE